jgi:hypothetical protein
VNMARERLFKAELIEIRKAASNGADRKHLLRWEEDDWRAQQIWNKFKAHNPAASPKEFIAYNLGFRRYAEAVPAPADVKDWHKEWRDYFARCATNIFNPRQSSSASRALLGILYREADAALYLHKSRLPPKSYISRQNKTRKHDKTQRIETQSQDNWRTRRLFMIEIGTFWDERCGGLDCGAVAALTEIALPGAALDAEQVRNVWRSVKAATGELAPEKTA